MKLTALYRRIADHLDSSGDWVLPSLARLVFAAVLLRYYWNSALTKLDGPFGVTDGGYGQIFPRAFDDVAFDSSALGNFHYMVVLAGAWAEILLPLAIVAGVCTRLAALGMIGFVTLQSLTDIFGHMVGPETTGAWFDAASGSVIVDQRSFWILALLVLLAKGAGPLSIDRGLQLMGVGLTRRQRQNSA